MKSKPFLFLVAGPLMGFSLLTSPLFAQDAKKEKMSTIEQTIPVHLLNFNTVETHMQMDRYQTLAGGINLFYHIRNVVAIDEQTTIAMNRDTNYSFGVLNLSEPLKVTLPDSDGRFMSIQVVSEDHYTPMAYYDPGTYVLTEEAVGSKYAMLLVRTFVDPTLAKDLKAVNALQDQLKIEGGGDAKFVLPDYDMDTYKPLFADLQGLVKYWKGDTEGSMGKKGELNELLHTVATAGGWGLNAPEDATYTVVNGDFDPKSKYRIEVPADIPVQGFWSISVYNSAGFFVQNDQEAYTINGVTGKKNDDGSITVYLGECEGEDNCLPLPGEGSWYEWRFYRPDSSVRDGSWKIPEAVQVQR